MAGTPVRSEDHPRSTGARRVRRGAAVTAKAEPQRPHAKRKRTLYGLTALGCVHRAFRSGAPSSIPTILQLQRSERASGSASPRLYSTMILKINEFACGKIAHSVAWPLSGDGRPVMNDRNWVGSCRAVLRLKIYTFRADEPEPQKRTKWTTAAKGPGDRCSNSCPGNPRRISSRTKAVAS